MHDNKQVLSAFASALSFCPVFALFEPMTTAFRALVPAAALCQEAACAVLGSWAWPPTGGGGKCGNIDERCTCLVCVPSVKCERHLLGTRQGGSGVVLVNHFAGLLAHSEQPAKVNTSVCQLDVRCTWYV